MIEKGKIASIISALFLGGLIIVMGYIIQNSESVPGILTSIGLPGTIITLAAALIVGGADYFYPTVKEVWETGALLQFTWGGFLNILSGVVIFVLMVITQKPELLQPLLSEETYAIFTLMILPAAVLVLKFLISRKPGITVETPSPGYERLTQIKEQQETTSEEETIPLEEEGYN